MPRDLDNKQPQCLATTTPITPGSCSGKGKVVWAAQMESGSNLFWWVLFDHVPAQCGIAAAT